jgi:hypothetical protein
VKSLFVRFWTDEGFVLRIFVTLVSAAGFYYAQPANRPFEERLIGGLIGALPTAGATVMGLKSEKPPEK